VLHSERGASIPLIVLTFRGQLFTEVATSFVIEVPVAVGLPEQNQVRPQLELRSEERKLLIDLLRRPRAPGHRDLAVITSANLDRAVRSNGQEAGVGQLHHVVSPSEAVLGLVPDDVGEKPSVGNASSSSEEVARHGDADLRRRVRSHEEFRQPGDH
jgi:hypothetical protein